MDTSLDETTVVATTEGHMEGLHPFGEDVAEQITQAEGSTTPSVLSRFKKGGPGSCDICGRTETTVWRKLVLGGKDHRVCNRTSFPFIHSFGRVLSRLNEKSMRAVSHQIRRHPPTRIMG